MASVILLFSLFTFLDRAGWCSSNALDLQSDLNLTWLLVNSVILYNVAWFPQLNTGVVP